jgi:SpoVK/Ycf46/Vps4 family AAA+-type ATPase
MREKCSIGYKNGREHLYDELAKLDTLIHLQVLRFRDLNSSKQDDRLSGLCIQDEDVDRVMEVRKKQSKGQKKQEMRTLIKQVESIREKISRKVENSLKQGIYLPLYHLARIFQLTSFELDIILVCLAPEMDIKYEKLYAYLQDDVTKKSPSINFILELLCTTLEKKIDARACFFNQSPLLKYQLVRFMEESQSRPLLSRGVKLDDRIVNFLLEQNVMDSDFELSSFAKIINPTRDWSSVVMEDDLNERLSRLKEAFFRRGERGCIIFYLKGPYGVGKKLTAEAFCYEVKLPLIIVDMNELLMSSSDSQSNVEKIVERLFRETLLQPAAIYLEHFDSLISSDPREIHFQNVISRAVEEFSFVTFLAGEKPWNPPPQLKKHPSIFIQIEFSIPSFQLRKQLWEISLNGNSSISSELNIEEVANKFQFTGGQIKDAAAEAQNIAIMKGSFEKEGITMRDLYSGCHAQSNHNLSKMARKIIPRYTWCDIVLPPDKLQQLKEMCNYVKYRHVVYSDWGFDRKISLGKGLNILFSGPSGTGKTMASEIIANELNLDFYKIDLSCVVSKYIGETEKNLSAIFKEAETANAVLFFDEADALFGKRSEVKDAHDRYANIEINYLLQKMEEHEGIVILATNFRKNIDEAFTRRMHFTLDFPFPDEEYRLNIWQKIFPAETPKSTAIDYEFMARKFEISGGSIKNIALNSAFLAANNNNSRKVNMTHIIHATKREYQKMGKLCDQSDFGKYYHSIICEAGGGRNQ